MHPQTENHCYSNMPFGTQCIPIPPFPRVVNSHCFIPYPSLSLNISLQCIWSLTQKTWCLKLVQGKGMVYTDHTAQHTETGRRTLHHLKRCCLSCWLGKKKQIICQSYLKIYILQSRITWPQGPTPQGTWRLTRVKTNSEKWSYRNSPGVEPPHRAM